MCILFAIFILCSAVSSLPSARPDTGTYIKDDLDHDGYGLLTIHNNWTMDTVAVLAPDAQHAGGLASERVSGGIHKGALS